MKFSDLKKKFKKNKVGIPTSIEFLPDNTNINNMLIKRLRIPDEDKKVLSTIWMWDLAGIGPTMAKKFYYITPENIKSHLHKLPHITQMTIIHKPLKKIERKSIPNYISKLLDGKVRNIEIVGSYRRGKPYSRDIDLLYTGNLQNLLKKIQRLHNNKWIILSEGKMKVSGIFKPLKMKPVKIDIWYATPKSKAFMKMYATGSWQFNIIMRKKAIKKNMTLNQYGLFDENGVEIPNLKTEKSIFKYLGMKYLNPEERDYGC